MMTKSGWWHKFQNPLAQRVCIGAVDVLRSLPATDASGGKAVLLAAVSGGADSVAMLRVLQLAGIPIAVANCNFHLRGKESDRDSAFVADLCDNLSIPLHHIDFDTEAVLRSNPGISVEMACRRLRHEWFDDLCREHGYLRIATGHNASDNAETLLLNLLRGSGLTGLKGMIPDNGRVVRPLLWATRSEIIALLNELGQPYVTDSTNMQSDYRRNFLRNEVMPMLRSRWEGADSAISRAMRNLQREHIILEAAYAKALEGITDLLPWQRINDFAEPVSLLRRFIAPWGGTGEIAEEIATHLPAPHPGKRWEWDDVVCIAEKTGLRLQKIPGREEADRQSPALRWEKIAVTDANRESLMKEIRADRSNRTVWLPYGEEQYVFRTARPGERIKLLGMKGSRLVSDIFAEGGLNPIERKGARLLAINDNATRHPGEAVWLPGMKRSRLHLIDPAHTEWIYRVYIPFV